MLLELYYNTSTAVVCHMELPGQNKLKVSIKKIEKIIIVLLQKCMRQHWQWQSSRCQYSVT